MGVNKTEVHEGGGGHVTKGGDNEDELLITTEGGWLA